MRKSGVQFEHVYPFDPTYGMGLDDLLKVGAPPEPAGYEAFWRSTRQEAAAIPLRITRREIEGTPRNRVYEIEFDTFGGFRCGGWMTTPKDAVAVRGAVVGHGYGGRDLYDDDLPGPAAVAIFPCARGFGRSRSPGIPDNCLIHVLSGIEHRDTYIHRGCVAELWAATGALLELAPDLRGKIDYQGGSFGGGIGAMALAWEDRIRRAWLGVPSFGNHPLRVTLPCTGSGEPVRQYVQQHLEALDVLAFYDAAIAARRTRIPVMATCALFDPAVPPPGQFAVYNALGGPTELHTRQAGHFDWPRLAGEDLAQNRAVARWMEH